MGSADACRAHLLSFPHSASPLQEHHKYSLSFGALRIFNQLTCGAIAFFFLRITDHDMFSEHYANKTKCPTQVRELILDFCLQGK